VTGVFSFRIFFPAFHFPVVSRPLVSGLALLAAAHVGAASAETISSALARAYANNPDINQQRAAVRAFDETVPAAKAGWLPKVSAGIQGGYQASNISNAAGTGGSAKYTSTPTTYTATVSQTLFDGNRTANSVGQAESTVLAQRESLRLAELTTLQAAATAYMDVLRDTSVLGLKRSNVRVLEVQLRQTRDRHQLGELTRTDVAQTEASLAAAQADFALARANLDNSIASFRRQVGVDPKNLAPAQPVEKLLPRSVQLAMETALEEHPSILGALHQADAAEQAVKVAEAALLPTVSVQGEALKSSDSGGVSGYSQRSLAVMGHLTVPIYQGGSEYAGVRQAKETLGQARLAVDSAAHRRARRHRHQLGPPAGGQRGDHRLSGRRQGGGSGAQRRARGGQGRPAHHA